MDRIRTIHPLPQFTYATSLLTEMLLAVWFQLYIFSLEKYAERKGLTHDYRQ
jgi:hypothetical protein